MPFPCIILYSVPVLTGVSTFANIIALCPAVVGVTAMEKIILSIPLSLFVSVVLIESISPATTAIDCPVILFTPVSVAL